MRIYQHQVCDRCLPIRHKTSDGAYGPSVEECLQALNNLWEMM